MGKKKFYFLIGIILIAAVGTSTYFLLIDNFDDEGRYDSSHLNMLGVLYEHRDNNTAFNEGFSKSDSCPWGFAHDGIDYFLVNDSTVIAAAPGKVVSINSRDYGSGVENRYHTSIEIQYNESTFVGYNFEPWSQNEGDLDHQMNLFNVQKGDWVEKGQKIATFLEIGSGAHIHFDVREGGEKPCPSKYFDTNGYTELMEMIQSFHPSWNLCYP